MRLFVTIILGALLLAAAMFVSTGTDQWSPRPKVFVFGIDGGSWNVIDPMLARGELPNLASLHKRGLRGVLRSRPPALSPVVWTTIFTGHLPPKHGVRNWKTSHSTHRRVKPLWRITSQAGLETNVFNVPSTWPPEEVNGVMISGFPLAGSQVGGGTGNVMTLNEIFNSKAAAIYRDNVDVLARAGVHLGVGQWSDWLEVGLDDHPAWEGRMKVKHLSEGSFYISPFYRTDPGLVISHPPGLARRLRLEQAYIPEGPGWSRWREDATPTYLYDHLVDVSRIQTSAASMFAAGDWDVFVYVNTLVDRVSHPYWAYMEPQDYQGVDRDKAGLYREAVRDAYRETDRQLGSMLAKIDPGAYVIIVSDHGFQSSPNPDNQIGTHRFDGIYLMAGPRIVAGDGRRLNIEDIAPSLLYLLGLPVGRDMTGKVSPDLIGFHRRPPARIDSYETVEIEGSDLPVDESTWEQLRSLGYVSGEAPTGRLSDQ